MSLLQKYWVKEIFELTGLWIFGLLISIVLPAAAGFAAGGFELGEYLDKYMFYYGFVFGGLILLTVLKIRELIISPNAPSDDKATLFSTAIVHDPEQDGFMPFMFKKLGFEKLTRWLSNPLRVFIISLIIFTFVGLGGALTNTFFTSIPQTEFQVTETSKVIFAAEPAAFGETIMFIALISIQFGIIRYLCIKNKIDKWVFWVLSLMIIPLLGGFEWLGMHLLRYGSQDTALQAVFVFGAIGSLMTLLFGTFIFWYVWHFCNNAFIKINEIVVSDEKILLFTILFEFILIISWITIEIMIQKSKRKKDSISVVEN